MEHPSYQQVYTDTTGHAECVYVRYDPARVTLQELAELYFQIIDPLSLNKQGEDVGTRYRTGVFYDNEADCEILREVASGNMTAEEAENRLKTLPFDDVGFANRDNHRELRTGQPEAVFCEGKTPEQAAEIMKRLADSHERAAYNEYFRQNSRMGMDVF